MAFFDEFGKKISQTGQSAVQKTKEAADLAKINTLIAEEEKKINGQCLQIGKLYAADHSDDYEENFAPYMSAIKEANERIRALHQQSMDIRGLVNCEKCGTPMPKHVAFCSSCGAPMPKQEVPEITTDLIPCIGCGQMVSRENKFCTSCGKPVEESIQAERFNKEKYEKENI
ncbi:MAG: zinc ribbon domain-containing protein [Lachnospiraceae bacterium]|nr:zinc ribbon domain-containing protein [Lachnospiraceae bacterium]